MLFCSRNEYKTAFHCTVQRKVKYNERNMKLRDKDTKKYLLSVAVSTFVSYVVTFISFMGEFTTILSRLLAFVFAC